MKEETPADSTEEVAAHKIEDFAEDLGRLLGNAQTKAEGWLSQRATIVKHLSDIRDTSAKLLADLGHQAEQAVSQVTSRRGRPAGSKNKTAPAGSAESPKRRVMSPEARKLISEAQKARWASMKAKVKK